MQNVQLISSLALMTQDDQDGMLESVSFLGQGK